MNANKIWLDGTISPGSNYRLYLAPEFVDDGAGFLAIKAKSRQIGAVETFKNFAMDLPPAIDLDEYDVVVIWCEAFKQFITAALLENQAVCLYAPLVMGFAHRHKSGAKRKSPCWLR